MNLRVFAAAIVGLGISITAVVMLLGTGSSEIAKNPNQLPKPHIEAPPVVKTGPQPKVSVSEVEFQFGAMEVGDSLSHDFVFTNVGEVPLTIRMGETTCQCTYGDLKKGEERKILPGESQNIKLTWKPEGPNEQFSKGADILTDDPVQSKVSLRVVGVVGARIAVFPQGEWLCPDVLDDKPAICVGAVAAGVLEDFKVTSVESRGMPMEFELVPLDLEQLRTVQGAFGYQVRLTVKPDMQMGAFVFPVTIKTDVPEKGEHASPGKLTEFEVLISGVRRGPIRLAGSDWIEDKMAIRMGSFEVSAGKQVQVPMFIRNAPAEGFQFTKPPETTPPDLKVELVRDDKADGKTQRFVLKVAYPAGAPRVDFRALNPGKIRLFTNHPQSPEIELLVYVATY